MLRDVTTEMTECKCIRCQLFSPIEDRVLPYTKDSAVLTDSALDRFLRSISKVVVFSLFQIKSLTPVKPLTLSKFTWIPFTANRKITLHSTKLNKWKETDLFTNFDQNQIMYVRTRYIEDRINMGKIWQLKILLFTNFILILKYKTVHWFCSAYNKAQIG